MKLVHTVVAIASSLLVAACGPSVSDDDNGGGGDGGNQSDVDSGPCYPSGAETSAQACGDHLDNDCDGKKDCSDPECSGIGGCPICGQVDTSEGTGIPLPDGIVGTDCTNDSQCVDAAYPHCIENQCHSSYVSTLDVVGFGPNQVFDNPDIITSVCVTMEHTWLRDIDMRLIAPGGQVLRFQKFEGYDPVIEDYLGQANDCDSDTSPVAGVGATYCWKPTATNPTMLDYANVGTNMASVANCNSGTSTELPPGDYSAEDPWTQLNGSPLNGQWQFVVTDLWPIDNGFLFNWTIQFNPNAVSDCSGPIVN